MKSGHDPVRSGYHKLALDKDERQNMPGSKAGKGKQPDPRPVVKKMHTPLYSGKAKGK